MAAAFSIHIIFTDGGKPYWKRGMNYLELNRERRKWRKTYDLEFIPVDTVRDLHIYNYRATLKYPTPQLNLTWNMRGEGGK